MNIASLLNPFIQAHPKKPAIIHHGKSQTFLQLGQSTQFYVHKLTAIGIQPGDPVMVFVPMGLSLYPILLGIFAVGAVAVFVDAWADARRLNAVCRSIKPKCLISIPILFPVLLRSSSVRQIPRKLFPKTNSLQGDGQVQVVDGQADDTALITFTTGSTGVPKGANRTHGFLISQHLVLKDHLKLDSEKVDAPTLPIFILNNLAQGITSMIPSIQPAKPYAFKPGQVVSEFERYQVNSSVGSPVFYDRLADYLLSSGKTLSIQKIFVGGAAIFPSQATKLRRAFPNTEIEIVYGSTEAEPISSLSVDAYIEKNEGFYHLGLLVGQPVKQIQCRIIPWSTGPVSFLSESEFDLACLPVGVTGEIIVSGQHVLTGYFQNPDADALNKIRVGGVTWHRTGDCGYLNKLGELVLTGRCQQRIPVGTDFIDAFLVEGWLSSQGGIGTLIRQENHFVLVSEFGDETLVFQLKQAFPALKDVNIEFKKWRQLPRDPRHHSKIDYGKIGHR